MNILKNKQEFSIRTFKKNIKVYDFVTGKKNFESNKSVFMMLKEKIPNYKEIKDSGSLFEKKIFHDIKENNYLKSEFFLRIENLNQSLNDFQFSYAMYLNKIKENDLELLNDETSIPFRRINDFFCFGRCILDPGVQFYLD